MKSWLHLRVRNNQQTAVGKLAKYGEKCYFSCDAEVVMFSRDRAFGEVSCVKLESEDLAPLVLGAPSPYGRFLSKQPY